MLRYFGTSLDPAIRRARCGDRTGSAASASCWRLPAAVLNWMYYCRVTAGDMRPRPILSV
jgi:hypothetical protein